MPLIKKPKKRWGDFIFRWSVLAAFITHIVYCLSRPHYLVELVLGILFFPLGVLHGFWRWLEWILAQFNQLGPS